MEKIMVFSLIKKKTNFLKKKKVLLFQPDLSREQNENNREKASEVIGSNPTFCCNDLW